MWKLMNHGLVAILWMAGISSASQTACDPAHPVAGQSCANPGQPSGASLLQQSSHAKGNPTRIEKGSREWTAMSLRHELAQSKSLSSIFDKLSKRSDVPPKTKELFGLFRVCGQCKDYVRLGEAHDGGYLTCVDHNASHPSMGAFSLGVEHHDQWSEDVVSTLGAGQVHQFDCTVNSPPVKCRRCNFHKKCIRGASQIKANDKSSWTLHDAIDHAGFKDAADESLIMKMDIEGSEWDTLPEFGPDDLQKFKQITIEYHGISKEVNHDKYVTGLMSLKNGGFAPIHIHGNNYEGMYTVGELSVPNVLEVTYLRGGVADDCVADQQFDSLDTPNNPGVAELPAAHLEEMPEHQPTQSVMDRIFR